VCLSVRPSVRRQFRVLIDAAEPAQTVGQFRILMDRWNQARQIVRPGRRNSQGEETDRSFGLADEILKAKRRTDRSAWQTKFSRRREEAHGGFSLCVCLPRLFAVCIDTREKKIASHQCRTPQRKSFSSCSCSCFCFWGTAHD
jgi:hypothetical protein